MKNQNRFFESSKVTIPFKINKKNNVVSLKLLIPHRFRWGKINYKLLGELKSKRSWIMLHSVYKYIQGIYAYIYLGYICIHI